jgi:hypothetical protein
MLAEFAEKLIAIKDVPGLLARLKIKTCSVGTVNRWRTEGRGNAKLESFKVGNTCFTTEEALITFFKESGVADPSLLRSTLSKPSSRSKSKRDRLNSEAEKLGL